MTLLSFKKYRRVGLCLLLSTIIIEIIFVADLHHVLPASSDLKIDDITWEPEYPVYQGLLTVNLVVTNVGNMQSSGKYTISLYVDDWWIDGWLSRWVGFQPAPTPAIAPGQREVWHFKISDWTVFEEGKHQVKALVNDTNDPNAENNGMSKTLSILPSNYSNGFNIVNYGMCKNIDENGLPVNITEIYGLKDELAISYAYTDLKHADWPQRIGEKTNLTFRFYSPNGTLHAERSTGYSILPVRDPYGREITGVTFEISINKDHQAHGKEGDPFYDPGYQALNKYPGAWRVEASNSGHLFFSKNFIVENASIKTSSSTSSKTEPISRSTIATSAEGLGSHIEGGCVTAFAAIVFVGVVGCVALVTRSLKGRSSKIKANADLRST
jgi:hypothetical protein